jgi:hypothetical protein
MASGNSLNSAGKDAKSAAEGLNKVTESASFTEDALKSLGAIFKSSMEDIMDSAQGLDSITQKIAKSYERDIVNGIKKLGPSLEKSVAIQQKLNNGLDISVDIMKEQNNLAAEKEILNKRLARLDSTSAGFAEAVKKVKEGILNVEDEINDLMAQQATQSAANADIQERVANSMGITGNVLKGIVSLSPQFAKAIQADKVAKDMEDYAKSATTATTSVSRLAVAWHGVKSATLSAVTTLTDPAFLLGNLLKGFADVDKANVEFGRTTGQNANTLSNSYNTATGELITLSQYIKQASDLSKELGMNAMDIFSAEDLLQVSTMQKKMGMSVKEGNQLAIYSKLNGVSVKDNTKSLIAGVNAFNGQNKQGVLARGVLQDVASVSEDIAITYLGYPEKLGKAAAAAAAMGSNLAGVDKIANSLLNFESSIAAEMEAELLTGQSLNLEKARQYALDKDLEGLAKELLKQNITSASFSKLNSIAQDAQSKALGMTSTEMSKMLMKQSLTLGMSKLGLSEMEKQTLESMEHQAVQDKISDAVAQMQQAFAPIVGIIADIVSHTWVLKGAMAVIGGVYVVKMVAGLFRGVTATRLMVTNMKLAKGLGAKLSAIFGKPTPAVAPKVPPTLTPPKTILPTPTKTPLKTPGVGAKKNLQGLAAGLRSMGTPAGKIALGIVNLGLFGVAGAIALLSIPFLRSFQTINGIAIKTNFQSLAAGLRSFGTGNVGVGVINLAGLAVAGALMIVGSIGLGMFSLAAGALAVTLPPLTLALEAFGAAMLTGVGALGLAALVVASVGLGVAFALVGAGAMMMGKGISLAAEGFSMMVPHILSLIPQIPALGLLALSLVGIGAGLALIAVAGLQALPALMGLAALAAIGTGIYSTFSGDEDEGDSDKGMAKINANLEKLISLVEAGGDVYIDGAVAGKVIMMSESRMN